MGIISCLTLLMVSSLRRQLRRLKLMVLKGTVIRYQVTGGGWPPEYPADDARSWRNECELPAQRLADFLSKWKENYESLTWIGFPLAGWPNIWDEESCIAEDFKEMQGIMRSYGWPENFKLDECREALTEWEKQVLKRRQDELKAIDGY